MGNPLTIIQVVLAVASVVYQQKQAKKLKEAQRRLQEQAKDRAATRNIRTSGSAQPLEFLYGYTASSSIPVNINVTNSVTIPSGTSFGNLPAGSGSKNNYLVVQKAIGISGIDTAVAVDIDGDINTDSIYNNFHKIYPRLEGGRHSEIESNSSTISSTTKFTRAAYATEIYKMNRDDPQFGGVPNTFYYVKGRKVRTWDSSNNLSSTRSFSNNAVAVLFDYLTDQDGADYDTDQIDKASFAAAYRKADSEVQTSAAVSGRVFSENTRNIKKYEFNGNISTEASHQDNIETIIDTIPGGVLYRDAKGLLKLSVIGEDDTASGLSQATLTDSDLVRYIEVRYPDTNDRLNSITVVYPNASKNFAEDSYRYSSSTLLTADQNLPLESTMQLVGVSNKYAAQYQSQANVALSRRESYQFSTRSSGFVYEPGDVLKLESSAQDLGIDNDLYVRVVDVKVKPDLTIEFIAQKFEIADYTWTDQDDEALATEPTFDFSVPAPTGITVTTDSASETLLKDYTVSWTAVDDYAVTEYIVEVNPNSTGFVEAGRTKFGQNEFTYTPTTNGGHTFRVYSKTFDGRQSSYSSTSTSVSAVKTSSVVQNVTIDGSTVKVIKFDGTEVDSEIAGVSAARQAGQWWARVEETVSDFNAKAYNDSELNVILAQAVPGSGDDDNPTEQDTLWVYVDSDTDGVFEATRVFRYESSSWNEYENIITGDLIATGTITADKFDTIGTDGGARVVIDSKGVSVYDSSNKLRVRLGDLSDI